jgi:hypothetical protein
MRRGSKKIAEWSLLVGTTSAGLDLRDEKDASGRTRQRKVVQRQSMEWWRPLSLPTSMSGEKRLGGGFAAACSVMCGTITCREPAGDFVASGFRRW